MEHFAYGTLEQTVQATVSAILIPDVVRSGSRYRAAVRSGCEQLLWVDAIEQLAGSAWDAALDQVERMCEERLRLSAQAAVERYVASLQPTLNSAAAIERVGRFRRDYATMMLKLHQLRDEDLERVLRDHPRLLTPEQVRTLDIRTLSRLRLEADDRLLAR